MSVLPTSVREAWPLTGEARPLTSGLINQTFVWDGHIVQQLNTQIFDPVLHEDTEAVTAHLASKGLQTPRLVRTKAGALWHTAPDGTVWRVQTPVGERTVEALTDPADAHSAGALVARFHAATSDLDWDFRNPRKGVHNTPQHLQTLTDAIEDGADHRLYDQVAPLAEQIRQAWARWDGRLDGPERVVHGDLKISNLRFTGQQAVALIDLDTLQRGTIAEELGDALRSWCNPNAEDARDARFDLDLFEAAMTGYATNGALTDGEWSDILPGVERICWELAARFAADALRESYFGWNPAAYPTRGDHNLARAIGQAALAQAVGACRGDAEARLRRARGLTGS